MIVTKEVSFKKLLPSFYRFRNGVRYPGFS